MAAVQGGRCSIRASRKWSTPVHHRMNTTVMPASTTASKRERGLAPAGGKRLGFHFSRTPVLPDRSMPAQISVTMPKR